MSPLFSEFSFLSGVCAVIAQHYVAQERKLTRRVVSHLALGDMETAGEIDAEASRMAEGAIMLSNALLSADVENMLDALKFCEPKLARIVRGTLRAQRGVEGSIRLANFN